MTKILLVEDEALLRDEVLEWLELEGYEVVGAGDGLEGLKLARSEKPDLIISDITMPKLDGFGLLLELNSDPLTAGIPFIFVTARAAHDDIRQGMRMGADDYITKPFTLRELLEAVEIRLKKNSTRMQDYLDEIEHWQHAFEQEQSQRILKAKMIGMFSHDFRTPLSVIQSSIDLLRNYEDRLSGERKLTHLSKIDGSVKHLVQMLDDMLMVAQLESDYLEFKPESLELAFYVQSIVDEFASVHIDSHHVIFDNDIQGFFNIDEKLIRNILSNLLSNAIKYSPEGGEVLITLGLEADIIRLDVQDMGIGIPESHIQRLFEPFSRAENTENIKGTGLGLSIVKRCVELHNGKLSVDSKLGIGSTFCVRIPI